MATNDQIILQKLIEDQKAQRAPHLSDSNFFELFCAEQILKDYDLSHDDIESGLVGNGGDGGIDSIFFFINGELIREDTDLSIYKGSVEFELDIIQAKTSSGFSEDAITKFDASAHDLLQLGTDLKKLSKVYNEDLMRVVARFREAHARFAGKLPPLAIRFYYVAPASEVHPNVSRQVARLQKTIKSLFSSADFSFDFLGAQELVALARREVTRVRVLQLAENPISVDSSFACLVNLRDYLNFISDENGKFAKSMFDSNVRDYQGDIEVNNAIRHTLENQGGEDFWWLNNGVTVLASEASHSGKSLTIRDPQIVNGLQTSQEIHKVLSGRGEPDNRRLLVRVIKAKAGESYERIVRATNSQTSVPLASLRATDALHRDIEDYLKSMDIYYERRKNFYKNEGRPWDRIISIGYLAQAIMAVNLGRPDDARARPSMLIKGDAEYRTVFNPDYPLPFYFICITLVKDSEFFLKDNGADRKGVNNLKYYMAMLVARLVTNNANPTPVELAGIKPADLTEDVFKRSYEVILPLYEKFGADDQAAKGSGILEELNELIPKLLIKRKLT